MRIEYTEKELDGFTLFHLLLNLDPKRSKRYLAKLLYKTEENYPGDIEKITEDRLKPYIKKIDRVLSRTKDSTRFPRVSLDSIVFMFDEIRITHYNGNMEQMMHEIFHILACDDELQLIITCHEYEEEYKKECIENGIEEAYNHFITHFFNECCNRKGNGKTAEIEYNNSTAAILGKPIEIPFKLRNQLFKSNNDTTTEGSATAHDHSQSPNGDPGHPVEEAPVGYDPFDLLSFDSAEDYLERARQAFKRGKEEYKKTNYSEADRHFQEARLLFQIDPIKNREDIIKTDCECANLYWRMGKHKEARELLEEIQMDLNSSNSDEIIDADKYLADSYNSFALNASRRYALGEAIDYHLKALELKKKRYERNPDDSDALYRLCKTYNNLGYIYRKAKEYKKAKEYYEMAIAAKKEGISKDNQRFRTTLFTTYSNYALVLSDLGESDEARNYIEMAINQRRRLKEEGVSIDSDMSISYLNYGLILQKSGQNRRAGEYLLLAIKLRKELCDSKHEAVDSYRLANAYRHYADYLAEDNRGNAEDYYTKAIEIYESLEEGAPNCYKQPLSSSYYCLARITKDPSKAKLRYKLAEENGEYVFNVFDGYKQEYKDLLETYILFLESNNSSEEDSSLLDTLKTKRDSLDP